jgi:AraC-like DNA-binding protein
LLARLELEAEVYVNGDFCGAWAVDTSGGRRIPFHLVGRGEAWLHHEGCPVRHVTAGDLVVLPHDSHHVLASSAKKPPARLINADNSEQEGAATWLICGFFDLHNKAAWPLLEAMASVVILELGDLTEIPDARKLIELMISELNREAPGYYAAINHLAYLLFLEVIRQQIAAGHVGEGLLSALFDAKISRALGAIHNQPNKHWTLELLASHATMGRSSFASRFNSLVGMPAMQYLTHWRMQEARHLLKNTDLSVWEIAERCGYESEAAFRKAFKKTLGKTPGDVRRLA